MSVSARARGQLEPSHAHYTHWRLNGEHSNAHRRPWSCMMIQRANEQARTCRSCREVLSEQEVYRLLASVFFVGTGPWQWLRVAASSWCQQPMTNGWRQLGTGKGLWRRKSTKHTVADFRRCFSLITTYNHTNFPTAAGEVETHKFQLSIVYHLLLFSAGVHRLPWSRFLASAMLSKDSTRTELGKRPIPTRGQGDNLNTITYRRSLLSQKPNSYHRGNREDKREDNLVGHSLLLFGYSGNIQVASSPGWGRHRTARPEPRCVPPFFLFHFPLAWRETQIPRVRLSTFLQTKKSVCFPSPCAQIEKVRVTPNHKTTKVRKKWATSRDRSEAARYVVYVPR